MGGHIILTGDFNARTGEQPDYVVLDSDMYVPLPPEYCADTPITRASQDTSMNSYGKKLLDLCISAGLRIVNGKAGVDRNRGK